MQRRRGPLRCSASGPLRCSARRGRFRAAERLRATAPSARRATAPSAERLRATAPSWPLARHRAPLVGLARGFPCVAAPASLAGRLVPRPLACIKGWPLFAGPLTPSCAARVALPRLGALAALFRSDPTMMRTAHVQLDILI